MEFLRIKNERNKSLNILFKFFFTKLIFLFFVVNLVYAESIKKKLELRIYNFKIGHFEYNQKIEKNIFMVNVNGKIKNFFFLRNFEVSSGSIGYVFPKNEFRPYEASFKWNLNKNFYKNKIVFENNEVVYFESSGAPDFLKSDFNPIAKKGVIDPITALIYFLKNSKIENICQSKLSIIDGYRLAHVYFDNKIRKNNDEVLCEGTLERAQGFKKNLFYRRFSKFSIYYEKKQDGYFEVKKLWFKTFLGKIYVKVNN